MSKLSTKNIVPGEPTHPGVFIKEEIEYRKLPQSKIARDMGISRSYLNEILNGRKNITFELAVKFERFLDIGADFLLRMQQQYDMDCLRLKYEKQLNRLSSMRRVAV